jgi:hypothetical protein
VRCLKKIKMEHEKIFWVRWHPIDKIYTKRIGACRSLYSIRRRLATSATLLNAKTHQLPS